MSIGTAAIGEVAILEAPSTPLTLMTDYHPTTTVSSGSWTPSTGATLYETIDDPVADDGDYDLSSTNPTADAMEVSGFGITSLASGNLIVKYRIKADASCPASLVLREGTTTRKTWTHATVPADWTQYEQTLTTAETATIVDPTQLRVQTIAN